MHKQHLRDGAQEPKIPRAGCKGKVKQRYRATPSKGCKALFVHKSSAATANADQSHTSKRRAVENFAEYQGDDFRGGADKRRDILSDTLVRVVDLPQVHHSVVSGICEEAGQQGLGQVCAPRKDEALLDKVLESKQGRGRDDDEHKVPEGAVEVSCTRFSEPCVYKPATLAPVKFGERSILENRPEFPTI